MNEHGLTPEELKQRYATAIAESRTFKTHGVSDQAAIDYLKTPEGVLYRQRLIEAALPGTTESIIFDRAVGQLITGRELPRMELIKESLVKAVPAGAELSKFSPFLGKEAAFDAALKSGQSISDYFGLPIQSEAPRYDLYRLVPKGPTEVFISTVAPTSELGGQVTKRGGGEQYLAPNRGLYHDGVYLKTIDNQLALQAERSLGATVLKGAGIVGAAVDLSATINRSGELARQNNLVGGQSEVVHYVSRNLGTLGGAALGAEAFGALGIESGPGALISGAVGGIAGAVLGDKLATAIDNHRIYNQDDKDGNNWNFNPQQPSRGWNRTIENTTIDPRVGDSQLRPFTHQSQTFTAPPALANELNYKASGVAVQLALAHAPRPQDPYALTPALSDTPSLSNSTWNRDAQTHVWSRTVTTGMLEHGMVNAHSEPADTQKAAELNRASNTVVAQNIANAPHAIAARYQSAYEQYGWHLLGAPETAVTTALRASDNTLKASDNQHYTRDADGQWTTPGWFSTTHTATGNIKDELSTTYQREHPAAQTPSPATVDGSRSRIPGSTQQAFPQLAAPPPATHAATARASAAYSPSPVVAAPKFAPAPKASTVPAPIAENLRDFRHAEHPLHTKYRSTLVQVHAMEGKGRMAHGAHSEQLASALTNAMHKDGFGGLARIEMRGPNHALQAVAHQNQPNAAGRELSVDVNTAMSRSVEQHSQDWSMRALPHVHQQVPAWERDGDPRHRDNPEHGLFNQLRTRIPEASENRLLQCTAACHSNGITDGNLIHSHLDEASMKLIFVGSSALATSATVDLNTSSPQPQQSIQHIQQFDQQQAQMRSQNQAQSAQVNQQGQTR